jgi:hypothetical protein
MTASLATPQNPLWSTERARPSIGRARRLRGPDPPARRAQPFADIGAAVAAAPRTVRRAELLPSQSPTEAL